MASDAVDLTTLARPFRYRVVRDTEGRPVIPGRLAQLALYIDHPRLFARLSAIPGVRRWQVGDQEARALVPLEALPGSPP